MHYYSIPPFFYHDSMYSNLPLPYLVQDIAIHDNGGNYSSDVSPTQHLLVCACHELACLVKSLGTSAAPLVAEPQSSK